MIGILLAAHALALIPAAAIAAKVATVGSTVVILLDEARSDLGRAGLEVRREALGARPSNEFTRWDERGSLGRRVRRLWAQCPAFASLRRLWAVQIIAPSPRT